jgi:NAD(P)-dependent dehydrogenase (short-subunit alcohol dehydrogenase family)
MELNGKVAIITGASSGIGRSSAIRLAAEGVRVALVARSRDGLQSVSDEIMAAGGDALVTPTDVTSWEQTEAMAQTVIRHFGAIDILSRPQSCRQRKATDNENPRSSN